MNLSKNKHYLIIGTLFAIATGVLFLTGTKQNKLRDPVPGSCTIFSAAIGDKVLFGNNEDFYKPKTYLWTDPATDSNYSSVYLGFKDYSHQGGINEKGLCFDANALSKSRINLHEELDAPPTYAPPYEDFEMWIPVLILRKAATVEEAIELAKKYRRSNWYPKSGKIAYQLNFADAAGGAVVISVDKNGELAFTRKEKGENFLISTNFNKANTDNALEYPCKRYHTTEKALQEITSQDELTVEAFKSILESVHEKGIFNTTLYSNIFDLKNGVIYLYHWHQYDEVVVLKVDEELAKGRTMIRIEDLFSEGTGKKASTAYTGAIFLWTVVILAATALTISGFHQLRNRRL
ncbi:carcinine hydrolase/isopenicillin-N N-acyltransferase family protein [Maribellus mangrovi]|uniref:carcinine hydrolase/isopenicillin-N N-acyltransferase family protein n=1 Tax=Maribellus mangrovi TaxID=3133146 RepID=UPI0030EB4208